MNLILTILFICLLYVNKLAYSASFFVATIPAFLMLLHLYKANKKDKKTKQ